MSEQTGIDGIIRRLDDRRGAARRLVQRIAVARQEIADLEIEKRIAEAELEAFLEALALAATNGVPNEAIGEDEGEVTDADQA